MAAMAFDYRARLARASEEAGRAGFEALVVAPGPDLVYLAGYDPPPLERLTALIVRPGGDPVLVVPALERPRAQAAGTDEFAHVESWYR